MSQERRRIRLIRCDCTVGISELGGFINIFEETVHCETKNREMRCEVCGEIKE